MIQAWSFISAFILSFWMSRLAAGLPWPMARGASRTVAIHLLAGLVLFAGVGILKSYFVTFAAGEAAIVWLSQAIWLALDLTLTGSRNLGPSVRD